MKGKFKYIIPRLPAEREEEIMGKHEIFVKLVNLIGGMGGTVTFMPMVSSAKGLMTAESVRYTAEEMERLIHLAEENNIIVGFAPLPVSKGRLKCVRGEVRIGIRMGMSFDEYVYTLAHELAHYYLHYDKGDTIASDRHEEYEEQAGRAAKMLLAALSVGQKGGAE